MIFNKFQQGLVIVLVLGWLSGTLGEAGWKVPVDNFWGGESTINQWRFLADQVHSTEAYRIISAPIWDHTPPWQNYMGRDYLMINLSDSSSDFNPLANTRLFYYPEDWAYLPFYWSQTKDNKADKYFFIEEGRNERSTDPKLHSSARCKMLSLEELKGACTYQKSKSSRAWTDRTKITFSDSPANQQVRQAILKQNEEDERQNAQIQQKYQENSGASAQSQSIPTLDSLITKTVKLHKLLALQPSLQIALEEYWASDKGDSAKAALEGVWNSEATVKCDDNHKPSTGSTAKVPCLYVYTLETKAKPAGGIISQGRVPESSPPKLLTQA